MSSIKIFELNNNTLAGSDLFEDSESFLEEITDELKLAAVRGGFSENTIADLQRSLKNTIVLIPPDPDSIPPIPPDPVPTNISFRFTR